MMRWFIAILFLLVGSSAKAHTRSTSYSLWDIDGQEISVVLQVAEIDATSVSDSDPTSYFQRHLRAFDGVGSCKPVPASLLQMKAPSHSIRVRWQIVCEGPLVRIQSKIFSDIANHMHFLTINSEPLVLSRTNDDYVLPAQGVSTRFASLRFVESGITHILSGWDHIVFVLLLLFTARHLGEVATLVTGFTVGHSLSLAAVALGAIEVNSAWVECVIAASVICLAIENVWVTHDFKPSVLPSLTAIFLVAVGLLADVPPLFGIAVFMFCYFALVVRMPNGVLARGGIAALFGLFHGFGFAGVLSHGEQVVTLGTLFSFNVGVEVGQLLLVAIAWPVMLWLFSRNQRGNAVVYSAVIGMAVGTWALVIRAFGA